MKRLLSLLVVLLVATSATSGTFRIRPTYDRRFVNRTTLPIAFYELDQEAQAWKHLVTVNPYTEERIENLPTVYPNDGAVLLGADIGADGHAIDLAQNDFRVTNLRWVIRSDLRLAAVRYVR